MSPKQLYIYLLYYLNFWKFSTTKINQWSNISVWALQRESNVNISCFPEILSNWHTKMEVAALLSQDNKMDKSRSCLNKHNFPVSMANNVILNFSPRHTYATHWQQLSDSLLGHDPPVESHWSQVTAPKATKGQYQAC